MTPADFAAFEARLWESQSARLEPLLRLMDQGAQAGLRICETAAAELARIVHDCDQRAADATMRGEHAREWEARRAVAERDLAEAAQDLERMRRTLESER